MRSTRNALAWGGLLAAGLLLLSSNGGAAEPASPGLAQVGQKAPDFTLQDTDGKTRSLATYLAEGKTVVLEWFNPDCPFVRRHHQTLKTMERAYAENRNKGVVWLAINSGAPGNQGVGLQRNKQARKDYGIEYPILLDESGAVGRMYGAKTTPAMFVIRKDGILVYAGAIDDDPRGAKTDRVNYVSLALAANAAGKTMSPDRTDSYGCSVKYGSAASK